jgi:hypothetical protein
VDEAVMVAKELEHLKQMGIIEDEQMGADET